MLKRQDGLVTEQKNADCQRIQTTCRGRLVEGLVVTNWKQAYSANSHSPTPTESSPPQPPAHTYTKNLTGSQFSSINESERSQDAADCSLRAYCGRNNQIVGAGNDRWETVLAPCTGPGFVTTSPRSLHSAIE